MPDNIKTLFNKISKKYDFMNNVISFGTHLLVKKEAIKSLEIKPNSKVLDLCCGSGDLGRIIKKYHPTCDVIGVDFSPKMLEIARQKNQNITYWEMDATDLPFEKNSFDYIVMGFGLRNIPEKNKAIEEIHRILKNNGKFLHLDFGAQNCLSNIYDNIVLLLAKIFVKNTKEYKYLIISKNRFLKPNELIELFQFNKLEYLKHKNMFWNMISFQIMRKP